MVRPSVGYTTYRGSRPWASTSWLAWMTKHS